MTRLRHVLFLVVAVALVGNMLRIPPETIRSFLVNQMLFPFLVGICAGSMLEMVGGERLKKLSLNFSLWRLKFSLTAFVATHAIIKCAASKVLLSG